MVTAICRLFMPEGTPGGFYYSPLGLCAFHTGVTLTHLSSFNMEAVDLLCEAGMPTEPTVQRCRDGSAWALEEGASGKLGRLLCGPPSAPRTPLERAPLAPPVAPPAPPRCG